MFQKNPDPNLEPFFTSLCNGLIALGSGKFRSRYEVMKDANATDELQREMQRITTVLFVDGVAFGIAISAIVVAVVYGFYLKGGFTL